MEPVDIDWLWSVARDQEVTQCPNIIHVIQLVQVVAWINDKNNSTQGSGFGCASLSLLTALHIVGYFHSLVYNVADHISKPYIISLLTFQVRYPTTTKDIENTLYNWHNTMLLRHNITRGLN